MMGFRGYGSRGQHYVDEPEEEEPRYSVDPLLVFRCCSDTYIEAVTGDHEAAADLVPKPSLSEADIGNDDEDDNDDDYSDLSDDSSASSLTGEWKTGLAQLDHENHPGNGNELLSERHESRSSLAGSPRPHDPGIAKKPSIVIQNISTGSKKVVYRPRRRGLKPTVAKKVRSAYTTSGARKQIKRKLVSTLTSSPVRVRAQLCGVQLDIPTVIGGLVDERSNYARTHRLLQVRQKVLSANKEHEEEKHAVGTKVSFKVKFAGTATVHVYEQPNTYLHFRRMLKRMFCHCTFSCGNEVHAERLDFEIDLNQQDSRPNQSLKL